MTTQIHAIFTSNHHITSRNRTILMEQRAVWRGNFSLQEGTHFGFLTEWVNCANKKKDVLNSQENRHFVNVFDTNFSLFYFLHNCYLQGHFLIKFFKTSYHELNSYRRKEPWGRGNGSMLDGGEDGGVEGSNKLRFKVLKGEGQAYV